MECENAIFNFFLLWFMKEKYDGSPLLKAKVVLFCAVLFAMQKSMIKLTNH